MGIQDNSVVTDVDTEILDGEITQISNDFSETYYLDGEQEEELEMLVAKAMKLGELYERKKWQAAKAQAVPEGFAIKDVINERQRQISHEFYSTEHDDEYKSNELLRAAVCYAENVLSRGWIHRSSPNSGIYQSEEVPDFWPWDQDFWKPKSPRKDLVRAAALLIAEIERIDRAQEQKG